MKKLIFLNNLNSRICPKVDSDYPRGTCKIVVYHFHVTIQTNITSFLRPVLGTPAFALFLCEILIKFETQRFLKSAVCDDSQTPPTCSIWWSFGWDIWG